MIKNFNQFINESMKKITSEYKVGDKIIYKNTKWSYKLDKNIVTDEIGEIIELYNYDEDNWGTLNIKIIPDNKKFADRFGHKWISENDIVSKAF